jgi:rhomboid protease GluP
LYRYGISHAEGQYAEYTTLKGQELIQAEKYEEAYSYLNESINGEKTSNDHLFLLSVAEIELKKYDQAIRHLQQIISTDDTYHQAHYNLAVLYANGGDMTLAKEEVGKALEHDPTNENYQAFRDKLIE